MTPVWLHGWPLDERMWEREVDRFGGIAVRLYGRGDSIDDWAAEIAREVDGDRLALIGSSMGGYAALAIAAQAPERVAAIILVASKAAPDTPDRKAFRNELIAGLLKDGPPAQAVDGVTADELADCQAAIRDRPDRTDVVRRFDGVFVACAGSRDDLVTPEEAQALAAVAPNGRAATFDTGHFINLDDPDGFATLLETVL